MLVRYTLVYPSLLLGLTATLSLAAFGFPTNSDGIHPNIPSTLLDCYNSTYITTRDNLLPMTVNTLIALVRKLEDAVGGNYDVRTMSSALLSSYRFDGILYKPQLDPQGIPYAVEGNEFALWKLLYDKIIAKTGFMAPNDTLTWIERCTLHRMLSMSVEPYSRSDTNECPNLDRIQSQSSWSNRYPRELSKLSDVEMVPPKAGGESRIVHESYEDQLQSGNFMQDVSGFYATSRCPLENGVIRNRYGGALAPGLVLAGIAAGSQPQTVPPRNLFYMQPRSGGGGLKRKMYPSSYPNYPNNPSYPNYPNNPSYPNNPNNFKPNVNVNAYGNPQGRTFSAGQYGPTNNNNGGPYGNPGGANYPSNSGGRGNPSYPGYAPQGGDDAQLPIPSNINNKYAATLAGELAYVSIWMGPLRDGMLIGLDGGWNDTLVPKYYFQKSLVMDALTDARIRGSIDGLLLASNMENWINSFRSLKLSQLLNMYYSNKGVFSTDVKSCKRRDFYEQIAPINDLKDQTYATAYVLADLAPYVVPRLPDITSHASDVVRSYIPTLQDPSCPTDISNTPKPAPVVDLHLVLDYNWDYRYASRIIQYIIDNLELWKFGGNFTLINAKDGSVVIESSRSPLDFAQNFTYYYGNGGFDFTKILSQLKQRFQDKLDYDKQQYSGGGIPRVVVFMPYSSPSLPGSEGYSAQNRIQFFKENLPDVKFYYLVAGSKNTFAPYADNPDKDIFVVTQGSDVPSSLDPFINALITTPRRIIDPNCGKYWSGSWYNEVVLNGYLDNGEIHYYRVHPNYFFKGANAKITISTEGNAPVLTICNSRDNPLPIANLSRSGSVTCKQITSGNRYDMYLKDSDCSSVYYATQCKPFYFSIANQQAPSKTQISASCTDQECRDPDMSKYTIRHTGLSCYSSVSKLLVSVPVLLIALFINFSKII